MLRKYDAQLRVAGEDGHRQTQCMFIGMKKIKDIGLTLHAKEDLDKGTLLSIYGGSVSRVPPTGSCHDIPLKVTIEDTLSGVKQPAVEYSLIVYHLPQAGEKDPSRMQSSASHCCQVSAAFPKATQNAHFGSHHPQTAPFPLAHPLAPL